MNILYHQPSLDHIYAQRTIMYGYKDAFEALGHNFFIYTNNDRFLIQKILEENEIDIFITKHHFYYHKGIDFSVLNNRRKKGGIVITSALPVGEEKLNLGIRDTSSADEKYIEQVKDLVFGDIYMGVIEESDQRMNLFTIKTGEPYYCIPLACNPNQQFYDYNETYNKSIAFLGSWSSNKKKDFNELLYPLNNKGLVVYGQDRTWYERQLGKVQRIGQYFNIDFLSKIQKPKLALDAERKIYSSSDINLNIHERQQKKFGGDCNERLFKIPACKGFQITDNVSCINKYFIDGEEIVIAKNQKDWFEKINYYLNHPEERIKIAEAGQKKVLQNHTYQNRAQQILSIYYNKVGK